MASLRATVPLRRRVFGVARRQRADGGVLDVLRRVEVRLAGAEADDVFAFGLEGIGLGGDREGRRRRGAGARAGTASVAAGGSS